MVLKFIEDEYRYPLITNWNKYIRYFDNILPEETDEVPRPIVEKWHHSLKKYFSQPPTIKTITEFVSGLSGFTPEIVKQAKKEYFRLKKYSQLDDYMKRLYAEIFIH